MKKTNAFAALSLLLSLSIAPVTQAALVSSILEDVNILGKLYDVSFWADDSKWFYDSQSFDKLSGNGEALVFTTKADATAAITAIIARAPTFNFNPGAGNGENFRVAIDAGSSNYTYLTGYYGNAYGPFTRSINSGNNFSLATFSEVNSPSEVPVPAAAWLFGSVALGGFGLQRRKKKA